MSRLPSLKDTCPKCNGPKDKRSKYCIDCREYRTSNAEHADVRRYDAGCRCDLCKQANAARARQRKLHNPDKVRLEQSSWRQRNKDKINERRRKNKENKRSVAAAMVKRSLRERGVLLDVVTDVETGLTTGQIVYALIDPRSLEVRYVGSSVNGVSRAKAHNYYFDGTNKRKEDWIRQLKSEGIHYAMRVLETDPSDLIAAETYWISWFVDLGEHLYNVVRRNLDRPKLGRFKVLPDALIEDYVNGASIDSLSRTYKSSRVTVGRLLKRQGVSRGRISKSYTSEVKQDYIGGLTLTELSEKYGGCERTLATWLQKQGIKPRVGYNGPPAKCGTRSGHMRHLKLGEVPCTACKKASADHALARKLAKTVPLP